jgi:hypothetical protein
MFDLTLTTLGIFLSSMFISFISVRSSVEVLPEEVTWIELFGFFKQKKNLFSLKHSILLKDLTNIMINYLVIEINMNRLNNF